MRLSTTKHLRSKKKKIKAFKPLTRSKNIQDQIEFFIKKQKIFSENKIPYKDSIILSRLCIINRLASKLDSIDENKEDETIYDIVEVQNKKLLKIEVPKAKLFDPFDFIKQFGQNQAYTVLPEAMQSNYDDIPDENGLSKDELIETIQRFGETLNNITNKEKELNSKLDCSIYAEQYLDTLEEVATLYRKRIIPRKAADFFENKFAFGINLLDWYSEKIIKNGEKFDSKNYVFVSEFDKDDRWKNFKWFCRGGDNPSNYIEKFDEDARKYILTSEIENLKKEIKYKKRNNQPHDNEDHNLAIFTQFKRILLEYPGISDDDLVEIIKKNDWLDGEIDSEYDLEIKIEEFRLKYGKMKNAFILPDAMFEYESLPDEEGLTPSEVLEIMRNYSKQLNELSGKEAFLQTQIDCSLYVEQYLDILEEIAYLFNKRSLSTSATTYFENNFSYGLALIKWYTEKVANPNDDLQGRWEEFGKYVKSLEYEDGSKKSIEAYTEFVLPRAMLIYDKLDNDRTGVASGKKKNYRQRVNIEE